MIPTLELLSRVPRHDCDPLPSPQEHLILVCELLRANLFEFQRFTRASGEPPYFTLPRVRSIARQVIVNQVSGICSSDSSVLPGPFSGEPPHFTLPHVRSISRQVFQGRYLFCTILRVVCLLGSAACQVLTSCCASSFLGHDTTIASDEESSGLAAGSSAALFGHPKTCTSGRSSTCELDGNRAPDPAGAGLLALKLSQAVEAHPGSKADS